jgi:hypothetical protein
MEGAGIDVISRGSVMFTMYITHGSSVPPTGLGVSTALIFEFSCVAPTVERFAANPTDWNLQT